QYVQNDRTIEWPYLIPFLPFPFVEHYIGDRDNSALSFDLTIFFPQGWRWYGEFFLDDMLNPWKIFTDDMGNKWGLTIGVNYFGRVFKRDFTFIAEYSRVEPWVYTHFCGGSHRYSHFNVCLGSPLGPNSQGAVVKALLQVAKYYEIGIGIIHTAYNRNVRGGEITDIFQLENPENPEQYHDSMKKRFLGEGTEWSLQPTIYWNFNMFGIFELTSLVGVEVLDKMGDFRFCISGGLYF
ncbi:MAG: hypothetical protein N3D72_02950, partial [Candidatus Methanomethyliaceae archaeon]|nr:hypothetical protein [Candidatus Methanomethyliaceae archaeon]